MGSSTRAILNLVVSVLVVALLQMQTSRAAFRCGPGVMKCPSNQCCSGQGYCGTSSYACGDGCQSGPCYNMRETDLPVQAVESAEKENTLAQFITVQFFDNVFPARDGFYTYEAFLAATSAFPTFATTGSLIARKRDVAAFFAHVHHETAGLSMKDNADEPAADFCCVGRCLSSYSNKSFECLPGKKYFARGPLKMTWNYNYGSASEALGYDLLAEPELLSKDAVLSFKSALWLWMTPAADNKPSSHAVMSGPWSPSPSDIAASRLPGFGATIDILKGVDECGHASPEAEARAKNYVAIAKILNVSAGNHLGCATMLPF